MAKFYVLNPLAGIIELYRTAFFPTSSPAGTPSASRRPIAVLAPGHRPPVFHRLEGAVLKEI